MGEVGWCASSSGVSVSVAGSSTGASLGVHWMIALSSTGASLGVHSMLALSHAEQDGTACIVLVVCMHKLSIHDMLDRGISEFQDTVQ